MSTFDMTSNLAPAAGVASQLEAAWESGLNAAAVLKIKPRWDAIVGTAPLWTANVADRSNRQWKDFPNPQFESKSGRSPAMIIGLQLKKLNASFDKAKAAHDAQFDAGAALFQAAVTGKRANWTNNVAPTLGLTGDRLLGTRGPASQHVRAAAGDLTYLRDNPSGWTGENDPPSLTPAQIPYIKKFARAAFKAAFEGLLIQTGVFLLTQVITDVTPVNLILDDILTGFIATGGAAPPTSFIHFEGGTPFVLHTHLDNNGVEA